MALATREESVRGEHATREAEVDDLLRGEVLVDLYQVTRQALRASVPSYSIKEIEALYGFERSAEVSGGTESVLLAVQAARDARPDVARPRMVLPATAHAAFHKAAHYRSVGRRSSCLV